MIPAILALAMTAAVPGVGPGSEAAPVEGVVGRALGAFFPGLAPGEAPGVVAGPRRAKRVPEDGELRERVRLSPLTNAEREEAVLALFRSVGAEPAATALSGLGQRNIVAVKAGRTGRLLIVGGHHDKVRQGSGTIDNWTGATMVVNLYEALRDVPTEHTIVFATFGGEESGLVGSRAFVAGLTPERRALLDGMLNFDTLAVDGTFSWRNGSDKRLLGEAAEAARAGGYGLRAVDFSGGDADSSSFSRAGLPAMTLFGASPEVVFRIIHSENDQFARFSLEHYKNAFLLSRALLLRLDAAP